MDPTARVTYFISQFNQTQYACFLPRLKLTGARAHAADKASRIARKHNENSSSPVSTYTEIYTHDPTHLCIYSPGLQTRQTSTFHTTKSGKAQPRVLPRHAAARIGEASAHTPWSLEVGIEWGGGSGGAAAAEDEELASMEEKRACGGDVRSGAATEEIGRARVPLPLLGRGGGGGGGGVRGGRFSLVAGERAEEAEPPRRPGSCRRVRSGSRSGRSLLSEFGLHGP